MDDSAFAARLAEAQAAIERELENLLGLEPKPGEPARPKRLIEAMRYATLGGGKRLRAFLTIETARALGRTDEGPRRAGAAIECVHAYSLIHDDLPSMDDDDLRRGRPTTHRAFDEATAILAGDALQALAFEILADPATDPLAEARVALCLGLARAIGLAGMVGGQMLDIAAERRTAPLSVEEIARLQAMKTGALLKFSVEAGTRLAGAGATARTALETYGRAIGAAFQIADDILDVESDAATLGKRAGKDAEQNKGTLVGALGLDGARRELARLVDEAVVGGGRGGRGRRWRRLARDRALRRQAEEVSPAAKPWVALTPPALRPCARSSRRSTAFSLPLRKRRIEKPGSSARPALVSDCASSSFPRFASVAASKKWVSGLVRLISIERRNNVTASSLAPRAILAAPAKCSQSQAKLSRGERRMASFSWAPVSSGRPDKYLGETDVAVSCR